MRFLTLPHFLRAPSSTWPSKVVCFLTLPLFWVRLRALTSFECAFEPSLPFESPHFLSSAPSSPRPFFWVRLRAFTSFECAFDPSTILLSAPSSPHFPFSFFYLGRSPITMRPFSFYLGRSPITMRPFLFYLGRSPITMRPVSLYLSKKKIFVLFFIKQVAWNN